MECPEELRADNARSDATYLLGVVFHWAAGSLGVPGFDGFGVPEGRSAVEVSNGSRSASLCGVGSPGGWFDAAMGGALFDAPEFASGVCVSNDGAHRYAFRFMMSARVSSVRQRIAHAPMAASVAGCQLKMAPIMKRATVAMVIAWFLSVG